MRKLLVLATALATAFVLAFPAAATRGDSQAGGSPAVIGFTLVDADLDQDVAALLDGDVIDVGATPQFNIRAETSDAAVGSVGFAVTDADGDAVAFRLDGQNRENLEPFAAGGDWPVGNYLPMQLRPGEYTLTATPYIGGNLTGTAGTPMSVTFTVGLAISGDSVLSAVMNRGVLRCGISGFAPGFSLETSPGVFEGFDVEMCRVVSAAVLGDANAVEFVPVSAAERFQALLDGTVDVLMRNTTETLSRDALATNGGPGVNFGPTYFYDGQGILADSSAPGLGAIGVDSTIADLPDGTTVCLPLGLGRLEVNFLAAAAAAGLTFTTVAVDSFGQAVGFLLDGTCDVMTSDRTNLAGLKSDFISDGFSGANDWVVLKQTISKEPLAPVVADGDDGWLAVVSWSVHATFFAEEVGITSSNIDDPGVRDSTTDISLAFGTLAADTGALLGLDAEWAYQVIKQVGNYGEIYDVHLEPSFLERAGTLNDQYLDGGLIYAPPIR